MRHEPLPPHLTVAVSGINARPDNPGPGLAVARCLREEPSFRGRIIGLGYDSLDAGLYLDGLCDAGYLMPYPSSGEDALIERIRAIHAADPFDVLIPCLDAELPGLIRIRPLLASLGIGLLLPSAEQFSMRNKDRLADLAKVAGVDIPESRRITDEGFFHQCEAEGWGYPLVVKGLFYDAQVVHNPVQAVGAFRRIREQWGVPLIVQRFIAGEEVNLTGIGDGEGRLLGAVMMKKRAVTEKGKAWAGISIHDERLLDVARRLVAALRWRGPLEVEVMRSHEGEYLLIEVNPRFPAWVYLSVGVGRNLPSLLVNLALGRDVGGLDGYRTGQIYLRYAAETIVSLEDYESVVMHGVRAGDGSESLIRSAS